VESLIDGIRVGGTKEAEIKALVSRNLALTTEQAVMKQIKGIKDQMAVAVAVNEEAAAVMSALQGLSPNFNSEQRGRIGEAVRAQFQQEQSLERAKTLSSTESQRTQQAESQRRSREQELIQDLDPMRERNILQQEYEALLRKTELAARNARPGTAEQEKQIERLGQIRIKLLEMDPAAKLVQGAFENMARSMADAAANALVFGDNMHDALEQIGKQLLAQLLSGGIGLGFDKITGGNTFGTKSLASGGYTGNVGTQQVAGIVHGQEFVMNASATRKNRPMLEALNKGVSAAPSAGAVQVNVNNTAGVIVETQPVSPGVINIMIRKAIAEDVPGLVANEVSNPNGRVSKALSRNIEAGRRR
jgi:hypothetical protein